MCNVLIERKTILFSSDIFGEPVYNNCAFSKEHQEEIDTDMQMHICISRVYISTPNGLLPKH